MYVRVLGFFSCFLLNVVYSLLPRQEQATYISRIGKVRASFDKVTVTLSLRGGIGEAMDGESISARGLSDVLETFEAFGDGPRTVDQSGSTFEAKPDHFNQPDNRMDGKWTKRNTTSLNVRTRI